MLKLLEFRWYSFSRTDILIDSGETKCGMHTNRKIHCDFYRVEMGNVAFSIYVLEKMMCCLSGCCRLYES